MSNELIARLRAAPFPASTLGREAADEIERLAARLDAALARDAMIANHDCSSDGCAVPDGYTKEGAAFAQKYHDLKAERDSLVSRLRTLAIGIVGARMAHVEEDYAEAYHLLYTAAKELSDDPHEPWKGVDALADGAIERRDGQTFVKILAVEKPAIIGVDMASGPDVTAYRCTRCGHIQRQPLVGPPVCPNCG